MSAGSGIHLELVEIPCPLCRRDAPGPALFEGHDVEFRTCDNRFRFVSCTECGHVYLSPRPRENDFGTIYANYLTTNDRSAYHPSGLVAWIKRHLFDQRRLSPVLRNLRPGSNVLEIGAGSGAELAFLGKMADCPVHLYANDIEFDETTRRTLGERGIQVLEGAVERVETDLRFDAILGIHVIEHVVDPRAVFGWIAEHLAPRGVLYFETPDLHAPARYLFGSHWGMTHFPRHLHLFSREKLAELARGAGLEILHHGATTSAPAWNMSIRNTLGMDALTKHRSLFEIFNYSNVLTLSFFTAVDLALILARARTSTQQLIARKPEDRPPEENLYEVRS